MYVYKLWKMDEYFTREGGVGRGGACDVDGRISDHWAHVVGGKKAKLGKSDACGIIEKYQIIILYAICTWFGI